MENGTGRLEFHVSTSCLRWFRHCHLKDKNSSILLKLGYNIVTKEKALWVRVLHSKYGMCERFPKDIAKGSCSAIWRGIAKVWPLLKENLCWSIGTGSLACCWGDPWIPRVWLLKKLLPPIVQLVKDCFLKYMVTKEGTWNLQAFTEWVSEEVVKKLWTFLLCIL